MAFNNTRTILLHGPRGMEWYCPTPARPPWETDKRHHQEIVRDTHWAAKPFPLSDATILGDRATPGWEKRWSWSYIEACNSHRGLSRHFLRRNPRGELLLRENLIGHSYRVLVNAADGVLPAQPDADFPEPHCSRPLMDLHCYTDHNGKGEALDYYYVAYKHPNGSPLLPPKVAETMRALQKRDGTWCLLPKIYTQVPESWQPAKKQEENMAQEPVLEANAAGPLVVVNGLLKETTAVVTSAFNTCTNFATKVLEVCGSAFTNEAEGKTQGPTQPKSAEPQAEDKRQTTTTIPKLGQDASPVPSTSNYGNSGDFGNHGNSSWSWTAIQMTDAAKTTHCLRCSPEGKLLLKKQLIGATFTIFRRNVDCTVPAEPSMEEIEEALSLTHVEIAPNTYTAVNAFNGQPQLPELMARKYDLHKNPVAQEPVLEANAAGPPAVVKEVEANDPAKSEIKSFASNCGNSPNFPITKLPTYPILADLEKLISTHLVCSNAQRTVLALWILHTYASAAMTVTPYLNIYSPIEESGKTTCLGLLRALCAQPWWAGGTSPSTFKRRLSAESNTVLLDNWHTLFRASDKHPMTGFLLNGCDFVPDFCAHLERQTHKIDVCRVSPKAFAGSESLPPALARRSIPIVLQRRKPAETVVSLNYLMLSPKTAKIASAMKAWAQEHREAITQAHAKCSTRLMLGLTPHQQESARVLLAVAATIGGDWPVKACDALMEIFNDYNEGQVSAIQLLSDIRDAFAHHGSPKCLFTAELLAYLHGLDHRTYDQWNKQGDPMTAAALARILYKHFEIYPRTQRRRKKDGKEERFKGYQLADFQEAWERYLPSLEVMNEVAKEPGQKLEMPRSGPDRLKPAAGSQASSFVSPNKNAPCHGVTARKSNPKIPPSHQPNRWQQTQAKSIAILKNIVGKAVGIFTANHP